MRVTPDTTVGELQAWLDARGAKITFQLAPRYPRPVGTERHGRECGDWPERAMDEELDEAIEKFERALSGPSWKVSP